MTDAEYLFITDCSEKKRVARSASNKNRVGKGPCRLPHDNMSKKELKKMNSKVVTYKLNCPISWKTFLRYPHDIQQEYLDSIASKYHPNAHDLAEMFRAKVKTLYAYFRRNNLNAHLHNNMPSCSEDDEWSKFLSKKDADSIQLEMKEDTAIYIPSASFTIVGRINDLHLQKFLKMICFDNKTYKFTISFEEMEENGQ